MHGENGENGELKRAEPMLRATSSSVLRSDVVSTGDGEGPGAERREAPPARGLNYKGATITEQNIKDVVGPKWAWRIGKLAPFVWFVDDDWQAADLRDGVLMHNREAAARHRLAFGEKARACWWHVTELTLEHLRGWTPLQKLLAEVQGDFWKGDEEKAGVADNKKRRSRRRHDRVSATDGWERPVAVADA